MKQKPVRRTKNVKLKAALVFANERIKLLEFHRQTALNERNAAHASLVEMTIRYRELTGIIPRYDHGRDRFQISHIYDRRVLQRHGAREILTRMVDVWVDEIERSYGGVL